MQIPKGRHYELIVAFQDGLHQMFFVKDASESMDNTGAGWKSIPNQSRYSANA